MEMFLDALLLHLTTLINRPFVWGQFFPYRRSSLLLLNFSIALDHFIDCKTVHKTDKLILVSRSKSPNIVWTSSVAVEKR